MVNCLLYYSVFFIVLEVGVYLPFIITSTLHLRYDITLHCYNFLLIIYLTLQDQIINRTNIYNYNTTIIFFNSHATSFPVVLLW